ncbi:hypothetical protein PVAND_008292 [Polypedilum vanderplanki]|uniref:Peptidase S1 domain-containing protein n=1 Tax=Polypedilum vanderplanki TaxID=319348 RepID=A0A9J6C912_POLVA|nr:hypothetical protein PVAND_008292 [Polypedilum vanderplanki]
MSLKFLLFFLTFSICSYALKFDTISQSSLKFNRKIAGGTKAERNEFLYKCALYITKITEELNFCSGSIISDRFVISAAHCFSNITTGVIFAGVHNLKEEEAPYDYDFEVTDVILHEEYDASTYLNDIALINVTAYPFDFTNSKNFIQKIQIVTELISNDNLVGMIGRIAGWGQTTDENREISNELLYIDAEIIDLYNCKVIFGNKIRSTNLCLKSDDSRSTCQGDSGGGLQVTINGENFIVALVSFGAEDGCEKNYPVVFTFLPPYFKWINSIVNRD